MARNRLNQPHPKTREGGHINWFASADSGVEGIADWDIKSQTLGEAILGVLGAGSAIMFGVSMAGDAVSVTIYTGDIKHRKWVTDSIELDDLMALIWKQGRPRVVDISQAKSEQAAD